LANHKSAIKRIWVNERRRKRNRVIISQTRTEVRKARELIAQKDQSAKEATLEAIRLLDKAASKGVIHKNNAARRKSRLVKRLQELSAQ